MVGVIAVVVVVVVVSGRRLPIGQHERVALVWRTSNRRRLALVGTLLLGVILAAVELLQLLQTVQRSEPLAQRPRHTGSGRGRFRSS